MAQPIQTAAVRISGLNRSGDRRQRNQSAAVEAKQSFNAAVSELDRIIVIGTRDIVKGPHCKFVIIAELLANRRQYLSRITL